MKKLFCIISMVLAVGISPLIAEGSAYPSKRVELIVPWSPGGSSDVIARAVVSVAGKYFPKSISVTNKEGGGGTVGTTYALRQKANGYTMLLTAWGPLVTQPNLKDLQYSLDDATSVMQIGYTPFMLGAHPDSPYSNMKEFIEYAKENPGKINVGIIAIGSADHLAFCELQQEYGIKLNLIPQVGGAGGAKVSLLGHHVDVAALNVNVMGELLETDQVIGLGLASDERFESLPNLKTCAEQGYPMSCGVATNLYVSSDTPEEIVKTIHDYFYATINDPDFVELAKKLKFVIVYRNTEDSMEFLKETDASYKKVIKSIGL